MSLFLPEGTVAVQRDEAAFAPDALLAIDLAYGVALAYGDDEAFLNTVGRTAWTVGDPGESGTEPDEGHASTALLSMCTGNAEACWLWSLSEFVADPIPCLRRVRDYYVANGYTRSPQGPCS